MPNAKVHGNHCTITAPNAQVWGNHNTGTGPNIEMWGNHNRVTGPNGRLHGNHCIATGPNCVVIGQHGRAIGPGSCVREDSGSNTLPDRRYRKISGTTSDDAAYTNSVVFSGSGMVITINKNGRPYARYEGRGNIDQMTDGRLIVDGVDITEACRVDTPSSSGGRKRKSDHDEPAPKRVLPKDHKCTEAKDDEKECAVCQNNRVDARLDPCGHTSLCVDCAVKIYNTAKRECPLCKKSVERVDVVFL